VGIALIALHHFIMGHGGLGIPGDDAHFLPVRGASPI
jgi:hypothetical protein